MAYDVADLTASVRDDLNDSSFSSSRLLRYFNLGQLAIFNTHEFKFCETSIVGPLTIGEHTFDQQTDWQSTIGGSLTDPDDTNRIKVLDEDNFLESAEFFDRYPNPDVLTSGMPEYWTEYGTQIYFDRPVDKAYILRQRYYRVPTTLTVDASVPEVPVAFRELLELFALYRSEKYRGNHDVAATYKQDFEDGLEAMLMRTSGNSLGMTVRRDARVRVDV